MRERKDTINQPNRMAHLSPWESFWVLPGQRLSYPASMSWPVCQRGFDLTVLEWRYQVRRLNCHSDRMTPTMTDIQEAGNLTFPSDILEVGSWGLGPLLFFRKRQKLPFYLGDVFYISWYCTVSHYVSLLHKWSLPPNPSCPPESLRWWIILIISTPPFSLRNIFYSKQRL